MWQYEKKLQYPVNIKSPNPAMAKVIVSQLGGPDGELGAAMRYLSQRYTAPSPIVKAILNDVGISVGEMLPLMGQGFPTPEVDELLCNTSVSEMFLSKCTSCLRGISWEEMNLLSGKDVLAVGGISWEEMLPSQNSMPDKLFSGILIHTIRSNEVLARYSKKNQFDKDTTPLKKTSRQEKIIRIFV